MFVNIGSHVVVELPGLDVYQFIDIMNTGEINLKTSALQSFLFQMRIYDTMKVTAILNCVLYFERPGI